jgi:hypothetical protein
MSMMVDDCERYKDQWTLSRYQRMVSPSPGLTATYTDDSEVFDLRWPSAGAPFGFFPTPASPPDYPDGIVGLALGGKM